VDTLPMSGGQGVASSNLASPTSQCRIITPDQSRGSASPRMSYDGQFCGVAARRRRVADLPVLAAGVRMAFEDYLNSGRRLT